MGYIGVTTHLTNHLLTSWDIQVVLLETLMAQKVGGWPWGETLILKFHRWNFAWNGDTTVDQIFTICILVYKKFSQARKPINKEWVHKDLDYTLWRCKLLGNSPNSMHFYCHLFRKILPFHILPFPCTKVFEPCRCHFCPLTCFASSHP